MFVHIRAGLVSGDVVVGGCYRIREREDECRGDVRCAHCVVVEGVEGAEDVCLERFFGFSTVETVNEFWNLYGQIGTKIIGCGAGTIISLSFRSNLTTLHF